MSATAAAALTGGLLLGATALGSGLSAQEQEADSGLPPWDGTRALIYEEQVWEPFRVEETRPLAAAMDDGIIQSTTPLLILQRPQGNLALSTDQMAYHHAAQGEMAGEPWMVSF